MKLVLKGFITYYESNTSKNNFKNTKKLNNNNNKTFGPYFALQKCVFLFVVSSSKYY